MKYFTINKKENWLTIIFEVKDKKVNLLSTPVMQELDQILDNLSRESAAAFVLFTSNKKNMFIAGADIEEIREIREQEQAEAKSHNGQMILEKLAALSQTTIALIDGPCLGGGLELALACDYRIVTDHPKTRLGLPEVKLGIIPAFGGTQRLPRLIGLRQALQLILTGRALSGEKSYQIGLADAYVPSAALESRSRDFIRKLKEQGRQPVLARRKNRRGLVEKLSEAIPLTRNIFYSSAKKMVLRLTKGHYPAPLSAIKVIRKTFHTSIQKGLKVERQFFSDLAVGQISKNLIHIFFSHEKLKKGSGQTLSPHYALPQSAAVIGAGVMGGAIGWLFSYAQIPVRLKDIAWSEVGKGREHIFSLYQGLLKKKKIKPHQAVLKEHLVSSTIDYSGFKQKDMIVEAIVENLELKKKVLAELENCVSSRAIIATNTSSLRVDDLAANMKHPQRFLGMHFFNPVHKMPLVEVVPGSKTVPEVTAAVQDLVVKLGKIPVVVQDCSGFLVNRILTQYLIEAIFLLNEGYDFTWLDRIMVDFGMPLGPFALLDEIGIDIGYKVANELIRAYQKQIKIPALFSHMVKEKKWLGKKSGIGFYIHSKAVKRSNPALYTLLGRKKGVIKPAAREEIIDRLYLIMVNEAYFCLQESIVEQADDLDMAMILGTGIPPFRGGLIRYSRQIGLTEIVRKLERLAGQYGNRFNPCSLLTREQGQ